MGDPDKAKDIYNHLDSIFNTVIDGIIIIDHRGIMHAVNSATSGIFGYTSEEMIGRNVSVLMPAPDSTNHDNYINNYLNSGVKKIIGIGREVRGKKKDGDIFPMRLSISESIIDDQRYFTGVVHDITEVVEARAELNQVNKQLEEIVGQRTEELTMTVNKLLKVNRQLKEEIERREQTECDLEIALEREKELNILKSQFVTMASHEFRTPLSTIMSSASIIARYDQAEQQNNRERHVGKIKSSVNSMTHILEDILSLGKLEEGKIENHPEKFDLLNFINGLSSKLNAVIKPQQEIRVEAGAGPWLVKWDKNIAENILNNLISNASKYSADGKPIYIRLTKDSTNMMIQIVDRGIGIPQNQQKHLFSRFFRATNAINIKGTGLGLNIVVQYLTQMNGKIDFESKQDEASKFTITIPKRYQ